jgi:hypothetical protein
MGDKTPALLDLLDMPHAILDPAQPESGLDRLLEAIEAKSVPGALLVRGGVIT